MPQLKIEKTTSYHKTYKKQIQYKENTLITVAGIALKGQADLISIIVPGFGFSQILVWVCWF